MVTTTKPKIFVFVAGGQGSDWQVGLAIAEDGVCLAAHISSSREHYRHDMGLTSESKHVAYAGHCPLGYELIDVPDDEISDHEGLGQALRRHQDLAEVAKDAH